MIVIFKPKGMISTITYTVLFNISLLLHSTDVEYAITIQSTAYQIFLNGNKFNAEKISLYIDSSTNNP